MIPNVIFLVTLAQYTEYVCKTTKFMGFSMKISIAEAYLYPNYGRNCHIQHVKPQFLHTLQNVHSKNGFNHCREQFYLSFKPKKIEFGQWELFFPSNAFFAVGKKAIVMVRSVEILSLV